MTRLLKPLLLSVFTYLIFFYPVLSTNTILYSGKDSSSYHYPARVYLYEKLKNNDFPFWTEKMFFGFPIFSDLERGYLNPINIILVYIFGPFTSYKILHFLTYLFGSLSLFYLLKKLNHNLIGFLAANLIYFFSTFILLHQQHFNTVMTLYLLPSLILFTSNKKFVLSSIILAYAVYLGSMQFVLLLLIAQLFWLLSTEKITLHLCRQLLTQYVLVLIISLPATYSVLMLFTKSERLIDTYLYNQGSFFPVMLTNLLIPFLFNVGDNFLGILINREFYSHEIYIYIGVSVAIVSMFYLLTSKVSELHKFTKLCILFFVIFAVIKFVPVLNSNLIPPFSLFRYWIRSVSILIFALSMIVSSFLSQQHYQISINKGMLKSVVSILILLLTIELINISNNNLLTFGRIFLRNDYRVHSLIYLALVLAIITFFLLTLFIKKRLSYFFVKKAVFAIVVIDICTSGLYIMNNSYKTVSDIMPTKNIVAHASERIFDFVSPVTGDNSLYFSNWSMHGYSVFVPSTVKHISMDLGFKDTRTLLSNRDYDKPYENPALLNNVSAYGVTKVITPNGTYKSINNFPIKSIEVSDVSIFIKKEQRYVLSLNKLTSQLDVVSTYLRFDPGWRVFVNGIEVKPTDNDGFLNFNLPISIQTNYLVEIIYQPTIFYRTLFISLTLTIIFILFNKKYAIII